MNTGNTQPGPKSSQIYSLKSGGSHNFKPMSSRKKQLFRVASCFLMTSRAQELFQAEKSSHLQPVAPIMWINTIKGEAGYTYAQAQQNAYVYT